ncbi:hypothetical protein QAD02_020867 [Eretmocerus hayati]|uniref:Uncharacterized protein n=1 Tax=Eretmocerus hayati TaxID=131215 RepID=A0ACC2PN98_9HYME|nr:hypothetical protein QAD02_020867 [Eretmocerus hayati]
MNLEEHNQGLYQIECSRIQKLGIHEITVSRARNAYATCEQDAPATTVIEVVHKLIQSNGYPILQQPQHRSAHEYSSTRQPGKNARACALPIGTSPLKHFSVDTDALDSLPLKLLRGANISDASLKFVKLTLRSYDGNASVERSSSLDKEFLVENLKEETLVALRNVDDAIRFFGGVDGIDITSQMRKASLGAHE